MPRHKVINWIEKNLKFPAKAHEKLQGKPFKLFNWQKDILRELFTKDGRVKPNKDTLWISGPRKYGKSCFVAAILLYFYFEKKKIGFECPILASTTNQGKLIFSLLKSMALLSFKGEFKAYKEKIETANKDNIIYIASKNEGGNFGGQPTVALYEEVAKHESKEGITAFSSAMVANPEPLEIYLTNPCTKIGHFSEDLLKRARKERDDPNSTWVVRIHEADPKLPIDSIEAWKQASPTLAEEKGNLVINLKKYQSQVKQALISDVEALDFRRFFLGQWVRNHLTQWITGDNWIEVDKKDYGVVCIGADLSVNRDMTSLCFVEEMNGGYYFRCNFYIPKAGLQKMRPSKKKQYEKWIYDEGWVQICGDEVIDQDHLLRDIKEVQKQADQVLFFGFDPHAGGVPFSKEVEKFGILTKLLRPIPSIMSPLISELTRVDQAGLFHYDGNPVLKSHFQNAMLSSTQSTYKRIQRAVLWDSIDGVFGCLNGIEHFFTEQGRDEKCYVG